MSKINILVIEKAEQIGNGGRTNYATKCYALSWAVVDDGKSKPALPGVMLTIITDRKDIADLFILGKRFSIDQDQSPEQTKNDKNK